VFSYCLLNARGRAGGALREPLEDYRLMMLQQGRYSDGDAQTLKREHIA
jgi:hypothetical protein